MRMSLLPEHSFSLSLIFLRFSLSLPCWRRRRPFFSMICTGGLRSPHLLPRHELSKMKACEVMKPLAPGFPSYEEVRVSVLRPSATMETRRRRAPMPSWPAKVEDHCIGGACGGRCLRRRVSLSLSLSLLNEPLSASSWLKTR